MYSSSACTCKQVCSHYLHWLLNHHTTLFGHTWWKVGSSTVLSVRCSFWLWAPVSTQHIKITTTLVSCKTIQPLTYCKYYQLQILYTLFSPIFAWQGTTSCTVYTVVFTLVIWIESRSTHPRGGWSRYCERTFLMTSVRTSFART